MSTYVKTSDINTISNFEDFIHTFYKNNEYLAKMYIRNSIHGTYTQFFQTNTFGHTATSGMDNMYMSMNPIRFLKDENGKYQIKRDKAHVAALRWLYVDLDTYKTELNNTQILMCLQEEYFDHLMPHPSLIIDSGRGMYLLWHINENILAYNRWIRVQKYLQETLQDFGADGAVVSDSARVFRCIGSINPKSNRIVSIIDSRNYQYTLYEIMQEYMYDNISPNTSNYQISKPAGSVPFNPYYKQLKARLEDLETLLLKHRDFEGSGRENILFLYRYWQCCITRNPEEALSRTKMLNQRLSWPLPKKELEKATRSAEKGFLNNCKYKYKSASVIQFLNISKDEMKDLKCFISSAQKSARKCEQAKSAYKRALYLKGEQEKRKKLQERLYKLSLCIQSGKSRKEICQYLHISNATYYRDMKILKKQSFKYRLINIRQKITGMPKRIRHIKHHSHFFCPVLLSTKYFNNSHQNQQTIQQTEPKKEVYKTIVKYPGSKMEHYSLDHSPFSRSS